MITAGYRHNPDPSGRRRTYFQYVIPKERKWLRLNLEASGGHVALCDAVFKLPGKQVSLGARLVCRELGAGLPARDRVQKWSTVSSWRKAGLPKQALSSRSVFTPFFSRIEPKTHLRFCVRAIPVCVFCGPRVVLSVSGWSLPGGLPACEAWALALGRDPLVMSRIGKRRRIGIGWRAVNAGDRLHNGVESSTVG